MRLVILLSAAMAIVFGGTGDLFAGPEPSGGKESKAVVQPAPPPECTWTGFYIGGFGGYSWGDNLRFREENETDPAYVFDQDSFIGGGEIGYNFQIGSWLVLGIEGTFAGGDFSDSDDIFPGSEHSRGHVDSSWIATIAERVGVSFWHNRLLAYVRGGAAFTEFDYHTEEVGGSERFDGDEERTAGLVGGGLEYAFTCHWSVKVEYNHLFFGSEDVDGIEKSGGPGVEKTFGSNVGDHDTVTAGINFKF